MPTVIPDYYGFGDENEAIVYADAHLHLWREIRRNKGLAEIEKTRGQYASRVY